MPRFRREIVNDKLFAYVIVLPREEYKKLKEISLKDYSFNALIDTGATSSAISKNVSERLQLSSRGKAQISTASAIESVNTYQVSIAIPIEEHEKITKDGESQINSGIHIKFHDLEVSELSQIPKDFDVIIGMDIIKQGILIVNGNDFTFAY